MDIKSRNGEKFEIFSNFLAHPVETPWSTPECVQVCVLHIGPHLASLRKIEMVAVRSTNETTFQFFEFLTPLPRPPGADGPHRGSGHVGRHCPYTNNIRCGSVHALLRYGSKTAKMQKFPIDPHSTKISFAPFSARRGPPTPKRGEDTSRIRVRLHANFGVNRPAGCREIVDRTNKQTNKPTVNQIPRPSL